MSWVNEMRVWGAYKTAKARNTDYAKMCKKYGKKNVVKVNMKKYIVFGDNLPYLIKGREGAKYGK